MPTWPLSSRRSVFEQCTRARVTPDCIENFSTRARCPHGHFRRGDRFLGKAHTLACALSRCSACNHLEFAAVTVMAGLWSVVAEAVVRACLTILVSFVCSCGV